MIVSGHEPVLVSWFHRVSSVSSRATYPRRVCKKLLRGSSFVVTGVALYPLLLEQVHKGSFLAAFCLESRWVSDSQQTSQHKQAPASLQDVSAGLFSPTFSQTVICMLSYPYT